ncbi:MAG: ImmA/IrrE family metallo-endopeptidase, partial [Alteromonas sp.]|nr:ImmA/IrrE family metallo-endopeptidase [Alteromonas sp.]
KSKDYKKPAIVVNSQQKAEEKNFTIAHEFAHYMLEHDGTSNYYIDDKPFDGSETMQLEGEANFFASILLIPKDKFLKLDLPFVSDAQLAERFGVSESMIGVRRSWIQRNGY